MGYVSPSKQFYQDLFEEHRLTLFLEGRYGSEHGYRKIWNEFRHNSQVKKYLTRAIDILRDKDASNKDKEEAEQKMQWAADHMRERIAAAKDDPDDPLHFNNAKSKNFTKGKTDDDAESYYSELENNIDAVAYAAKEKKMRTATTDGWKMLSSGKSKGELTKTASRDGTGVTSKTSKSDNVLVAPASDKKGEDTGKYKKIGISHKQGDKTQVAGGEPGEIRGIGNVVAKQSSMKFPKGKERDDEYNRVLSKFDRIANATDYRGDDEDEINRRKSIAQSEWDSMDPETLQSYTQAQTDRRGTFKKDKGSDINRASSDVIVKVPATGKSNQGSSTKDIRTNQGAITPQVSKSKGGAGSNRPMTNRQRTGTANTPDRTERTFQDYRNQQAQQDATPGTEHSDVVRHNQALERDTNGDRVSSLTGPNLAAVNDRLRNRGA